MNFQTQAPAQRGFTLIELMIAVAIVGVLAAVAYPSFIEQIRKGKRAECRSGLMRGLQQQERYYSQMNGYLEVTSSVAANTGGLLYFSGDSAANSACIITYQKCDVSATVPLQCIEVRGGNATGGDMSAPSSEKVQRLSLTSDNAKGCKYDGTTYANITTMPAHVKTACWP